MSSDTAGPFKLPAAKHTFNYIITLKIVFVQSIVRIKCGSMRLGKKKKPMTKQTSEGGKAKKTTGDEELGLQFGAESSASAFPPRS